MIYRSFARAAVLLWVLGVAPVAQGSQMMVPPYGSYFVTESVVSLTAAGTATQARCAAANYNGAGFSAAGVGSIGFSGAHGKTSFTIRYGVPGASMVKQILAQSSTGSFASQTGTATIYANNVLGSTAPYSAIFTQVDPQSLVGSVTLTLPDPGDSAGTCVQVVAISAVALAGPLLIGPGR